MRAFRLTDWGAAPSHEEVPAPVPGPGQVLVRVAGCGLCRSDLTMRQMPRAVGEKLGWQMPFTLGHETAGWLADGTPVALVATASCGKCWLCVRGLESGCPDGLTGRGYGRDGGLAEYVVADRRSVLPLGGLDPRHAGPLTDAGATAYHAVRRALPRIFPGGTAVVIGAGGLGAFAVQFLRLLTGARVVAVDTNADRLANARDIGAHDTLAGIDQTSVKAIRALTDGRGADAILDFVGIDATIGAGVAAVRPGGAYGLVGAAGGKLDAQWFSG